MWVLPQRATEVFSELTLTLGPAIFLRGFNLERTEIGSDPSKTAEAGPDPLFRTALLGTAHRAIPGCPKEAGPLTWHHEVNHGTVVPGKALGPAQLWLVRHGHQVPPATPRQVPHLPLLLLIAANALPALRKDVLGEADEPLSLLQQLQLQQVAATPYAVLAFLYVHNTLQLEPSAGERAGVGMSPVHQPHSHLQPVKLC